MMPVLYSMLTYSFAQLRLYPERTAGVELCEAFKGPGQITSTDASSSSTEHAGPVSVRHRKNCCVRHSDIVARRLYAINSTTGSGPCSQSRTGPSNRRSHYSHWSLRRESQDCACDSRSAASRRTGSSFRHRGHPRHSSGYYSSPATGHLQASSTRTRRSG